MSCRMVGSQARIATKSNTAVLAKQASAGTYTAPDPFIPIHQFRLHMQNFWRGNNKQYCLKFEQLPNAKSLFVLQPCFYRQKGKL